MLQIVLKAIKINNTFVIKITDGEKASGFAEDLPSKFDCAMKEICERAKSSDKAE